MTNDNIAALQKLSEDWQRAKLVEAAAKDHRIEIEQQIVAITGKRPDAGQITVTAGPAKIVVKTNISYTFDWAKWDAELAAKVPPHLHPVKTTPKREIDAGGIDYLREREPAIYAIVAQALTRKENKPGIEITLP